MADCSSSPSDEGGPGIRSAPRHKFLSHLHTRRGAVELERGIGTSYSDNLLPEGQVPVEPRGAVPLHRGIGAKYSDNLLPNGQAPVEPRDAEDAPPKRRSLAVSFAMTQRGDANVDNGRTGDEGAARQQQGETTGTSTTSSRGPPLGETSHFRGSIVRDTWSEHAGNLDGEFTFRCSSTVQNLRVSTENPGFDLVGSIICGPSESPVSSISSHRCSGKSAAGGEKVLDRWLRQTMKLRNSTVIGMRGTKGVPIVSKSLIELAEARREREAREESEESDLDSTSSSLTSEAAHGRHDVGGRIATKGVMRVSNVRSALPASPPVVTFRSPAESLSDSPPALLAGKSESGGGRGGTVTETKGLVRTSTLVASRSAISLTPRVTFKSLAVAEGTPVASSPLIPDKIRERDFVRRRPQGPVGKDETQKPGGGHGLASGGSSPGPMKGSPRVSASPVAAEPTTEASAGVATAAVPSTSENGPGSSKGAPDAAAATAPTLVNGRSGPSSNVSRTNDTGKNPAAGCLVSCDSPKKSTASTLQEGRTSDTPKKTSSTPDMKASLTAFEGIARDNRATIGPLPTEAIARQSAGEESSSAKLYPYAAFSSKNKRESQSKVVKPPELCRSDQDTVGSGAKSTEGTVGTPGVMGKGGTPSTPQDTMATQGKDVDTVKQAPLFKARIEISGGAAETLDEGASITSESTLEKLVPELDGSATKPEESKQGRFEAECERPNDELSQKGTGEQQSGDQEERIGPQPCEPAGGAEKEKMCETEGTRRAEGATMALSADASDREEHLDGHDRPGETEQEALPNTERTAANDGSPSKARQPACPAVAGPNQPETTPVTTKEQENSAPSPPTRSMAAAVRATIPEETRVDSALQHQFISAPDPNAILRSPVQVPLTTGGGDSASGGNEKAPAGILGKMSHEARGSDKSEESPSDPRSASSHPEAPLTARADGTSEPGRAKNLAKATSTLGNGGNTIRSEAISSTGLPYTDGGDGGVSCEMKSRSGKTDSASVDQRSPTVMEATKFLVVRDQWCMGILTGAAVKTASGGGNDGGNETLTTSPAKQTSDGHNVADGSTGKQDKSAPSNSKPREGVDSDTEVVKDASSANFQAETSRKPANNSSLKEPSAVSPAPSTGKARQGCPHENGKGETDEMDPVLPAAWLSLPSTEPSAVARDRWSVRVLVEARATLACNDALKRSASVSLETVSHLLPSGEDDDRCDPKLTGTEQRDCGSCGRCSASSCRRKRLSLPIVRRRSRRSSLSIGRTNHLCFPIAQARSGEGGVAASVPQRAACSPAPSELLIFVDVGPCLIGGQASRPVGRRGCTTCIRDGGNDSPGSVKNTNNSPRPSRGRPQRSKRVVNSSSERENVRVPTRPPGRAHRLDGMVTCISRASLAVEKNLAVGGSRSRPDGQDVPVQFHGHVVVSPACWTADGNGGDPGGRDLVAAGCGQRLLSPAPPAASVLITSAINTALRRSSCPLLRSSRPHLPIVVDTGSLQRDDSASAPAWAAKTPGLLRQKDVNVCRRTF